MEEIRSVDNIFGTTSIANNSNVEGISAVYACVKLLAQSIASTDLIHRDNDREVLSSSLISKRLKEPQKNQTWYSWMSSIAYDLVLKGNAYAIILDDELLYVESEKVQVYLTNQQENPYYYQINHYGKSFQLFPDSILHFKNISSDGIIGVNPIHTHSSTFNSSLAMQEYQTKFVDNSAQISGVLNITGVLKKETQLELKDNFSVKFGGSQNAGKIPVLPDNVEFKQLNRISPLDMDYINSAKLNKTQIAEIFQVPLSFLGTEMTYNNAEVESLRFNNYTLQPLFKSIEQEMSLKLLDTQDSKLEFIVDSIKMASTKEKSDSLSLLKNTGIITPNEARKHFGYPAIKGGDELTKEENLKGEALAQPKNTDDTNPTAEKITPPSKQ